MEHSTQEKKRYKWLLNAIEIRNRLATLGDTWYDVASVDAQPPFNHRLRWWISVNIPTRALQIPSGEDFVHEQ